MAKKNKPGKDQGESTDRIIDELAKDVGAEDESPEEMSTQADDKSEPVVPTEGGADSDGKRDFRPWPVDPDHESVTDMLMGAGGDPEGEQSFITDEELTGGGGGIINLLLFVLVLGALGGGAFMLWKVSAPEAIAAKKAEKEAAEKKFLEEQLAKQKKYGILRIESNPDQAVIYKNGEKIVVKDPETGEDLVAKTPTNMQDMDISETYKFRLELDGYEPYEFSVAEHIWTKDDTTGDYKLARIIDLVPINCEYYFLYDAKKRKEQRFEDKGTCAQYHDEAVAKGNQVTDCVCKVPPEGATADGAKDEKK